MATYTNTLFVQSQAAPYGPTTLATTDKLVLNLDLMTIQGNLLVTGAVTSSSTEQVLMGENHITLNAGYTTTSAQTGGLVVNTLPTATNENVAATGFVAHAGAANPYVFVETATGTFAEGDIIQISGASNLANNGLFEVLSHAASMVTIRGLGTTACVEDFTQTEFVADTTVAGVLTKVNISILRAGTDGTWEAAYGATSPLAFTDIGSDPAPTGTTNLTYTINSDNVGANENAALYMMSGNGAVTRQGQITMTFDGLADNVMAFSFNSAPPVTAQGFGYYFTPTTGGASSGGADAAGKGGGFYLAGGTGGASDGFAGSTAGAGGDVVLYAGFGGFGGGDIDAGDGGSFSIYGGAGGSAAGAGANGDGGTIMLTAGNVQGGGGIGATLYLYGGAAATGSGLASMDARGITLTGTTAGLTLVSGTGAINIGATDAVRSTNIATGGAAQTVTIGSTNTTSSLTLNSGTGALDIGTGAQARTITIGNAAATAANINATAITLTSVDAINLTDGIATLALGGTGATSLTAATTVDLDCTSTFEINSNGGAISIGNDNNAFAINIGTGAAARTVTIGNSTAAASVVLNAGTGNIDIGASNFARTTNLATGTGGQTVNVGSGAGANTVTVGSTNTTSSLTLAAGSGNIIVNGVLVGFTANAVEDIIVGDMLYLVNDGTVGKADADAAGKKFFVGIALNTATTGNPIRVASAPGQAVIVNTALEAGGGFDEAQVVYMSKTAGTLVTDVSGYTISGDTIYRAGFIHTLGAAGTAKILYMPQYIMTIA